MIINYYQEHKENLQKKHVNDINENLSEEEKDKRREKAQEEKEQNVSNSVNVIKIFLRNKSKTKLSIREIII